MFTLHIRNLLAIQNLCWQPTPLSVLVGQNGVGKTTVLLTLKFLRAAIDRGLSEAVSQVLGGISNLKNRRASEEDPLELGLDVGTLSWRLRLFTQGQRIGAPFEVLRKGDEVIFQSDGIRAPVFRDRALRLDRSDDRLGLRACLDLDREDSDVAQIVAFMRGLTAFYDHDRRHLRTQGSSLARNKYLSSTGDNAFTILQSWHSNRQERHRYEFVREGLRAAFRGLVQDLDFETALQSVSLRVYRTGEDLPLPIGSEADGVLQMLLLLSELAAAPDGGVVAIDDPENALHPFAIRAFLDLAQSWIRQHHLTLILTTHSPVLLDALTGQPDCIHVMKSGSANLPVRLDQLKDQQWLRRFKLGELYSDLEYGFDG